LAKSAGVSLQFSNVHVYVPEYKFKHYYGDVLSNNSNKNTGK